MRTLHTALLSLVLLSPLATALDPLALVHYDRDLTLRSRLSAQLPVYADLGGALVTRIDTATASKLQAASVALARIAEPAAGELLVAVYKLTPARLPAGVRVLLQDRQFLLVGAPEALVRQLHRGGLYNGGVEVIHLDRAYRPMRTRSFAGADGPPDPRIAALVAQVQKSNLIAHIQALSSLHTRRYNRPENRQAINYLKAELGKIPGVTVISHQFSIYSTTYYNVVAEIPGLETPDEIVMAGAHFDSLVSAGSTAAAPGADDNASGTASVLELARILATVPHQRTIRLGFWNAEEIGLYGSGAYAKDAANNNENIVAYLNTDMNAYRAPGDTVDLDFVTNDSSPSLITYMTGITNTYVPTLGVKQGSLSGGSSDHRSFTRNGFPAVFIFEDLDQYSPYIHTSQDDMVNSTNDMDLSRLITQSVLAGVASLAMPLEVPTMTLSVSSGPTVGGTSVTVTGTNLGSVTQVKMEGNPIDFFKTNGTITFVTPVATTSGAVTIEVTNPAGSATATFTYNLTTPPTLVLPAYMQRGVTSNGVIGGPPGHHAVTLLSPVGGTTNLGLVSVDIGGGNPASLLIYNSSPLSTGSGTTGLVLPVPNNPALVGIYLYFQACIIDPATLTIATTNLTPTYIY